MEFFVYQSLSLGLWFLFTLFASVGEHGHNTVHCFIFVLFRSMQLVIKPRDNIQQKIFTKVKRWNVLSCTNSEQCDMLTDQRRV